MIYLAQIPAEVAGIPCLVGVTEYVSVKGSFSHHAASDLDYYGYTECSWELLDRRGRRATWLDRKLTADGEDAIEAAVEAWFQSEREAA